MVAVLRRPDRAARVVLSPDHVRPARDGPLRSDPLPRLVRGAARRHHRRARRDGLGARRALRRRRGRADALYVATFPDRISALILGASYPRRTVAPGFPWGFDEKRQEEILSAYETRWGTPSFGVRSLAPSLADDERFRLWHAQACRFAGTPASAVAWFRITMEIDVSDVLPAIRVPTLVLHRRRPGRAGRGVRATSPSTSRARSWSSSPGSTTRRSSGTRTPIVDEVEEFLTGSRRAPSPTACSRPCCSPTSSTRPSAPPSSATRAGRSCSSATTSCARRELERLARPRDRAHRRRRPRDVRRPGARRPLRRRPSRGRPPARHRDPRRAPHGGDRAAGDDVARHRGAHRRADRGARRAGRGARRRTVQDLVAGSGIAFADRGAHVLKGVPGEWQLYAVASVRTA